MNALKEEIKDKQRIIFMGTDASRILDFTSKILLNIDKEHETIRLGGNGLLGDGPMVLIENQYEQFEHHILVVGYLNESQFDELDNIANNTPKAGCIVFNSKEKRVKKICGKNRTDVVQLAYKSDGPVGAFSGEQVAAVRTLLTRIRVSNDQFSDALQSLS